MEPGFFLSGLVLGFSIAAPVGPIGVLCIRRTLADGRLVGFVTGLGAATADATYGAVAAFGLTALSGALVGAQAWLRLVGGLFLLYLGVRTFVARPAREGAAVRATGLLSAYATTVVLTLTNPLTILSFAAMFAGLGVVGAGGDLGAAGALVVGVFLGSALWWLILSGMTGALRARLPTGGLRVVNRLSGVIIGGAGVLSLASLVR